MSTALVIRAAGTNCDVEVCRAFKLCGATPDLVHVDELIRDPSHADRADIIAFPGGFSYGDDVASGRIWAMKLRERLYPALRDAANRGVPMIGICNGFQALVQVGLLPGPGPGQRWPEDAPPPQKIALSDNIGARYIDQWVRVAPEASSPCIWTKPLNELFVDRPMDRADAMRLPIGHGEGRLVAPGPLLAEMAAAGHIALRYVDNVNGSDGAVAGVCDASGRIFGLMPHPDRFLDWTRHPYWTRLPPGVRAGEAPGLMMFRAAVEAVREVSAR